MKLIRPNIIDEAVLVSSSVAETDYPAWSLATSYSLAARVVKGHRIFESVQDSNINHDPLTADMGWWVDIGPTNRWAMFDEKVGTLTTVPTSLSVVMQPGRVDAIALLQVEASTVTVMMHLGSEEVYSRTLSMIDDSKVTDWFGYFFETIRPKDYVLLTDLPIYGEATITIALSKPSGDVSCGMCIVGRQSDIGGALSSPSLGINDYSKKTIDDFGNTTLVERSFSKRMSVKLTIDNTEVDRVHTVLSSVRSVPVVWIGSAQYSSMLVFGFFRDFEIDIAYVNFSYCTLNIEGMI